MTAENLRDAALSFFQGLWAEFPDLRIDIDPHSRNVDIDVSIPEQPGLKFRMEMNFQNEDELGVGAGGVFWSSWFPSSDADVVKRCHEAIVGIISGDYRIIAYRRWGQDIGGDLEAPADVGWKTVYSYRRGLLPFTWGASRHILQNQRPSNDALQLTRPAQGMEPRS